MRVAWENGRRGAIGWYQWKFVAFGYNSSFLSTMFNPLMMFHSLMMFQMWVILKSASSFWHWYLIRIPKQHHSNINMYDRSKTRSTRTMHILFSIPRPETFYFPFRRRAFRHSCVYICYPLKIWREFSSTDDLSLSILYFDGWIHLESRFLEGRFDGLWKRDDDRGGTSLD